MLSAAEENWAHCEVHLVDKSGLKVLADRIDAAAQPDVLAAGGGPRLVECRMNSVRHKMEGRTAFHLEWLAGVLGQYEDVRVIGWIVPPPTFPRIVAPVASHRAEHVAPEYPGADVLEAACREVVVGTDRPLAGTERLLESARRQEPSM